MRLPNPLAAYRRWQSRRSWRRVTKAARESASAFRQLGTAFERAGDILHAFQAVYDAMPEADKEEMRRLDASP